MYQSEFSLWWNHGYPIKIQGGEWYHYDFDGLKQRPALPNSSKTKDRDFCFGTVAYL